MSSRGRRRRQRLKNHDLGYDRHNKGLSLLKKQSRLHLERSRMPPKRRTDDVAALGNTAKTALPDEGSHMSESTPETTVDADQVVINNAPDGGGVDNNADAPADAAADTDAADDSEGDSDS